MGGRQCLEKEGCENEWLSLWLGIFRRRRQHCFIRLLTCICMFDSTYGHHPTIWMESLSFDRIYVKDSWDYSLIVARQRLAT